MSKLRTGLLFCAALAVPTLSTLAAASETLVSRGGRIPVVSGVEIVTQATGLERPWAIAWLPDGRAVITQKKGSLRLLNQDGTLDPAEIAFPVAVTGGGESWGQGGLLDVALHPDYAENGWLYFTYSTGDPSANRTAVGRARLEDGALTGFEEIWENPDDKRSGAHFGSRLLFLDDGSLLVSIGDGGNPPIMFDGDEIRKQAQNPATAFGSVIRLNDDGSVPEDNPFAGDEEVLAEMWSFGHRNIQGMAIDPETGAIWANEHGAGGGDELNRLEAGKNYGWPAVTFARNYRDGSLIADAIDGPEFTAPTVVWLDTNAPSGLLVYRGEAFADWDGMILSGGLVTQDLRLISLAEDGGRPSEQRLPIGHRVRDVRLGPDGQLYVLTDGEEARLLRLTPAP